VEADYGGYSSGQALLLVQVLRIMMLVLLPLTIIYLIISPEARKRALRTFIMLVLFTFLLYSLIPRQSGPSQFSGDMLTGMSPLEAPPPIGGSPEFVPGDMRSLVTVLSLAIAVLLTLVLIGVAYGIWRRKHPPEEGALVQLVREAQDTLDDIQSGGDLKNAVIRCYVEMGRVMSEQRGIRRGATMTPREFEARLVQEGLPESSVRQLTRLFEDVRYGAQEPGLIEEQRAVQCLSALVKAAQEAAR
jgi:hypothetical protein